MISGTRVHLLVFLVLAAACKTIPRGPAGLAASSLKLLSVYEIPYDFLYKSTTVGGLSGIDYDPAKNQYYLICDDRSSINPARFYTAKIALGEKGIDSVSFTAVTALLQPNGQPFPDYKLAPRLAPDPEAMRLNARESLLVWTSEGERVVSKSDTVLQDPAINAIGLNGLPKYSFYLPPNIHMQATPKGPRRNGVFEGLAFDREGRSMFVSMEEPLYDDGPRAGLGDTTGWIRIIRYDVASRKPVAQYAYRIDAVAHAPEPPGAFIVNGVPDILFLDNTHLLVTERSYSTGHPGCTIKLYVADLRQATDVSNIASLQGRQPFRPLTKTLLLNLDSLHIYTDNIEGATFGPTLPNGHRSLVFVSDNNFEEKEKTQFFLFEVR